MKTLIVHPKDKSTDFLCPIYSDIKNKIVIRGGISKKELLKAVNYCDRIIIMGHGSSLGLFAVGQFEQEGFMSYIIDRGFIPALSKKDNVYIWCHANQFTEQHKLTGFYSGMFISEMSEAKMYDLNANQHMIDYSNNSFSNIISKYINESSTFIYENVTSEYGAYSNNNPVVKYNNERLNYRTLSVHQTLL